MYNNTFVEFIKWCVEGIISYWMRFILGVVIVLITIAYFLFHNLYWLDIAQIFGIGISILFGISVLTYSADCCEKNRLQINTDIINNYNQLMAQLSKQQANQIELENSLTHVQRSLADIRSQISLAEVRALEASQIQARRESRHVQDLQTQELEVIRAQIDTIIASR